jgi:alginate O-acetyltransferase complex protein AlgI
VAFNSYGFIVFLVYIFAAYNLIPARVRPVLLLIASYLFYAESHLPHLGLLLVVTASAYVGGKSVAAHRGKSILAAWIVVTLLPLLIAKYLNFLIEVVSRLRGGEHPALVDIVLPIGISFYTFQAVSYLIDVYRGAVAPERSASRIALYLAWFPQILAGPIERAGKLLPQLERVRPSTVRNTYVAAKYLLWGFFCKLVVADNVALIVDRVLASPLHESGGSLTATFTLYSFQIYFDFLGYTSIAIGAARLFGVRLSRNFNRPYCATSLREFWRRWHITLSSWFRDYVYVPLGGKTTRGASRVGQILTVFLVSGLWHGAALNFVAWGGVHGVAYLIEEQIRRRFGSMGSKSRKLTFARRPWMVVLTFTIVTLAWVFFRLSDFSEIRAALARMLFIDRAVPYGSLNAVLTQPASAVFVFVLFVAIVLDSSGGIRVMNERIPKTVGQIVGELTLVNWLVLTLAFFGDRASRDFIYFRF